MATREGIGEKLIEVEDLEVSFKTYGGSVRAVRGVSLSIREGECLAVVGESGCGKSVTAQAIMGLLPRPPASVSGSVRLGGRELLTLGERGMRALRGSEIGMIFQDPMTSLDPTMPIGEQILEGLVEHTRRLGRSEARRRVVEVLGIVGIPDPERQLKRYAYEFSGGMRQRVVIAMAVICKPRLLIADEPTTALDVTTQAQILDLMRNLKRDLGTAVLLITHDMGVVSNMADRIAVLYAGKVVEEGGAEDVFYSPAHPYTAALLRSRPRLDLDRGQCLISIQGTPPDMFAPPPGCAFAPRCGCALAICSRAQPGSFPMGEGHAASCWLYHEKAIARHEAPTRARLETEVCRDR